MNAPSLEPLVFIPAVAAVLLALSTSGLSRVVQSERLLHRGRLGDSADEGIAVACNRCAQVKLHGLLWKQNCDSRCDSPISLQSMFPSFVLRLRVEQVVTSARTFNTGKTADFPLLWGGSFRD